MRPALCLLAGCALAACSSSTSQPDAFGDSHVGSNAPVVIVSGSQTPVSPVSIGNGPGCVLTLSARVSDADLGDPISSLWIVDGTSEAGGVLLGTARPEREPVIRNWSTTSSPALFVAGTHEVQLVVTDGTFESDGGLAPRPGMQPDGGVILSTTASVSWTINVSDGGC